MSNLDDINVPIRNNPRLMDIIIKPSKKEIVVKQRWKFILLTSQNYHTHAFPTTGMTDRVFIDDYFAKVKASVLQIWNNRFQIVETHPDNDSRKYKLVFEIERVDSGEHWEVFLYMFKKNPSEQEATDWDTGKIKLYLDSMNNQVREKDIGKKNHHVIAKQVNAAHEFGHMLRNIDEYKNNHKMSDHDFKRKAYNSLMNIGNELETKYVYYIVKQLSNYLSRNAKWSAVKLH